MGPLKHKIRLSKCELEFALTNKSNHPGAAIPEATGEPTLYNHFNFSPFA